MSYLKKHFPRTKTSQTNIGKRISILASVSHKELCFVSNTSQILFWPLKDHFEEMCGIIEYWNGVHD